MAQTTGAISFKDVKIEVSTDGNSWTDISGFANNIKLKGFTRNTGEYYTASGDTAILKAGKRKPGTITIECAYTEGAAEPYAIFDTAYSTPSDVYARWSPKGGSTGQKRFTSSVGIVSEPVYAVGDVEKGDIVKINCTLECVSITPSTIP